MHYVALQSESFDSKRELSRFDALNAGAIASFMGLVRSEHNIKALSIEHHPVMTYNALETLAIKTADYHDLLGVMIIHRYGYLPLDEEIVFVAAASAHRKESMDAIAFMMDHLKTDIPIWKKEVFADGSSHWIEQKRSDVMRAAKWHNNEYSD